MYAIGKVVIDLHKGRARVLIFRAQGERLYAEPDRINLSKAAVSKIVRVIEQEIDGDRVELETFFDRRKERRIQLGEHPNG